MPITVRCPRGHLLAVAEKYAGRQMKCPKCGSMLLVPGANGFAKAADGALKPPPLPKPTGGNLDVPPMAAPPVAATPSAAPPIVFAAAVAVHAAASPVIVERQTEVRGYRAERSRVLTVYWLALGLVALVIFQMAPVFMRLNPATAPNWARWVMMLALVQLAFIAWMASLPDWSTVRVTMFALAGVATLYCVALGMAVITPSTTPLMLDLDDVRDKVRLWCEAVLLLVCLMTYICGRVGFRWKKAYWTGNS